MSSHRIHLRGPWDFSWQGNSGETSELRSMSGTIAMPQEWRVLFGLDSGVARFRRKFHRPTNLEPHERVLIVFTEIRGIGRVQLNELDVGQFTATGNLIEFEITRLMNSFNELTVEILFEPAREPALSGGLYGVVALEIRTE